MPDQAEAVTEHPSAPCTVDERFRPSEYTALLIGAIRANRDRIRGACALEIGCGSGVVLAALADAGAKSVCGVDLEPDALRTSSRLLEDRACLGAAELLHGDMWAPVAGRLFDVVVANLPHFPSDRPLLGGRLRSWTDGGPNGRALLDRFLDGLAAHLDPSGFALITHGGSVDLDRTRAILAERGMTCEIVSGGLVMMSPQKLRSVTDSVARAELGRSILVYGPHIFNEVHVAEIRHADAKV
jgi:methylase of polypeptide subunit release factors